jgi:carbohydrate diacid regulator
VPRVAVVVDLIAPLDDGERAGADESTARLALLQTLRTTFTPAHDVVAAMPSDRFVALHRVASARPPDGHNDELRTLCRNAVDQLGRRHGLTAAVGIGDVATTVVELHDSYQDASIALRLGARLAARSDPGLKVTPIDDVRVHQLLAAVGHRPRARLIEALTADLRAQADWRALRQSLIAWCETGFNLIQAAAVLHIHRNTLVYRLNKIAQLTGRPARDHRAALALYFACLADQLDDDT